MVLLTDSFPGKGKLIIRCHLQTLPCWCFFRTFGAVCGEKGSFILEHETVLFSQVMHNGN